jgi:hypothetical protein
MGILSWFYDVGETARAAYGAYKAVRFRVKEAPKIARLGRHLLGGEGASAARATAARPDPDLLAQATDRRGPQGLTEAGRALAKRGRRPGSAFPAPTGSAEAINSQARGVVQSILNQQYRRVSFFNRRLGVQVVDIYDRAGRGLRYSEGGEFKGFLDRDDDRRRRRPHLRGDSGRGRRG